MKKSIKSIIISALIASLAIPALAVSVGSDVEYIPPTRNLGVGVIDPSAKLEVNGQVMITGGNPAAGKVLSSDARGLATWEVPTVLGSNVSGPVSNATNAVNATNINGGTITNSTFTNGVINGASLVNVTLPPVTNALISKLVASDGDPDPAVYVNADGKVTMVDRLTVDNYGPVKGVIDFAAPYYGYSVDLTAVTGNWSRSFNFFDNGKQLAGLGAYGSGTDDSLYYLFLSANGASHNDPKAITIPPSNNVGMGTNTPTERLEVVGNVKANNFIGNASGLTGIINVENANTANTATTAISAGTATTASSVNSGTITNSTFTGGVINGATLTNVVIGSNTHDHSRLLNPTTSAVALVVDSQSDVGIGTNTPTTDLHVVSDNKNGGVMVGSTVSGMYPILRGPVSTSFGIPNSDSFRINVNNNFTGNTNNDYLVFDKTDGNSGSPDGGIVFTNTGNDGVQETSLMIKGNGWIGVGENTPRSLLHMTGENSTLTAQHTQENLWSEFRTAGVNSSGDLVKKWSIGSTGDTRPDQNGGQNKFYIFQNTDESDADVRVYRMVITPEGNVGYGTMYPEEKLEVIGNVKATKFIGDGSMLTGISTGNVDNATTANFADYAIEADSVTTATSVTMADSVTNVIGGNVNNVSIKGTNSLTGQVTGGTINGSNLVNVTINDPNDPWILVHSEDFETAASGWSNNTRTSCDGHNILGGFNVGGKNVTFLKNFNLAGIQHSHVFVKFNYYSIDSWDDHAAILTVDGFPAWTEDRIHFAAAGRRVFPNCGSGGASAYSDRILQGSAVMAHTGNTVQLNFLSTLDEATNNESFGIDNVEIWVKKSGVVTSVAPPPVTPPPPPAPVDICTTHGSGAYLVGVPGIQDLYANYGGVLNLGGPVYHVGNTTWFSNNGLPPDPPGGTNYSPDSTTINQICKAVTGSNNVYATGLKRSDGWRSPNDNYLYTYNGSSWTTVRGSSGNKHYVISLDCVCH